MVYPLLKETIKKIYLSLASVQKALAWRQLKTAKKLCCIQTMPQKFMLHYVDATKYHKNLCCTMLMPQNTTYTTGSAT
jgi:hypothetical protein